MINVLKPGPSSAGEKRAAITLDFFYHTQLTGQTFKFYPVSSPSSSPSLSSSYTPSPATSSWDWSTASSSSSCTSSKRRRESTTSSPPSRHRTADFSHLPGMKILTKDGQDVTNSATRGCKTKEQRDHAHLMRIIKACDDCRRKKIRCDPSHKKRAATRAAPKSAVPKPAQSKTAVSHAPPPCPAPSIAEPAITFPASSWDFDSILSLQGSEEFGATNSSHDPFDEWINFPHDTPELDLMVNSDGLDLSPTLADARPEERLSSEHDSPFSQEPCAPPGPGTVGGQPGSPTPNLPFGERFDSSSDYTDFNLYSPASSFSEDERMLSIGSSTSSVSDPALQSHSSFPGLAHLSTSRESRLGQPSSPQPSDGPNSSGVASNEVLDSTVVSQPGSHRLLLVDKSGISGAANGEAHKWTVNGSERVRGPDDGYCSSPISENVKESSDEHRPSLHSTPEGAYVRSDMIAGNNIVVGDGPIDTVSAQGRLRKRSLGTCVPPTSPSGEGQMRRTTGSSSLCSSRMQTLRNSGNKYAQDVATCVSAGEFARLGQTQTTAIVTIPASALSSSRPETDNIYAEGMAASVSKAAETARTQTNGSLASTRATMTDPTVMMSGVALYVWTSILKAAASGLFADTIPGVRSVNRAASCQHFSLQRAPALCAA